MSLDPFHALADQTMARLLLQSGAIRVSTEQPFFLAAGWASPIYVDCRALFGDVIRRRKVTELAVALLRRSPSVTFDIIAGAETAGIPWACFIADRLSLPLRYVRKRKLGIGRDAQVEGGDVQGQRVLLVDDLTTDGGSKVAFTRGLREAGAVVEDALTIFHHGVFPGSAERLAELGLRLHALAGWDEILRLAPDDGFSAAQRAALTQFLADPVAWSGRHGGRMVV